MRVAFCGELTNGYFFSVFEGVKEWMKANPEARLTDWNGSYQIPPKALSYLRPDAILLGPHPLAELPADCRVAPIAGFSNRPDADGLPLVLNDDREVGRMAARALLECGYERIFVLESGSSPAVRRLDGFCEVMRADRRAVHRHAAELRRPRGGESFADVLAEQERSFRSFVRGLPVGSGIFCPLSAEVPQLVALLGEVGILSVPEELGVVVGDLPPPGSGDSAVIAHVRLNGAEVGHRACALLQEAVRTGRNPEPVRIEIAPRGVEWGGSLRPREGAGLLEAMTAYFAPRLAEPLRVPDMARHLGLSRRSLELKLQTLGLPSPFEHLKQLRLRKGEALLRESDLPIERIAELCGFTEVRSFTRSFREHHGCPPSRFRRQFR